MASWHGRHEIILRRLDEKGLIHLTESRINRALSSGIGVHSTKLIIHSVCCNPSDRIVLRFYEHLWTSTADAPKICLGAPKICVLVPKNVFYNIWHAQITNHKSATSTQTQMRCGNAPIFSTKIMHTIIGLPGNRVRLRIPNHRYYVQQFSNP